jgi:hypothetical protein
MQIKPVAEILAAEALGAPEINALVPNENNYTVLLMQPHGQIEASATGVWNRDRILAQRQFGRFLEDARQTGADLAITPEYSMPWDTLVAAIKAGTVPVQGKLWALGCESIKYSGLGELKRDLAGFAAVLFEPLQPDPVRFIDPLAFIFVAPPIEGGGAARIVMLVQFKTYPMGDDDHFEINGLQRGTCIYQFGGVGQSLKLVSLICSDAFAFKDEHAQAIYDRALVVHIQLTRKPRQEQYRQYRDRLLFYQGNATELICLNWARDVNEWSGGRATPWHNIAGSAWYLRPTQFDARDATLCANHRRGLYYTWLEPLRAHALFFNYEPATYLLEASKVDHLAVPASISRRRGPQLTRTCIWNDATTAWVEQVVAEDGFSAVAGESGNANDEIKRVAENNPIAAERILALCAGKIENGDNWHDVRHLDSCVIDSSEVIHRITFCQDTNEQAGAFRVARLKRCGHLWDILTAENHLPPALADFKDGFRLEWSIGFPHQNAVAVTTGKHATVIYMGEEASNTHVEAIAKRVAEFIHRRCTNPDESRSARQRLAVWFRENQEVTLYDPHLYTQIDQTSENSEFDIGREK